MDKYDVKKAHKPLYSGRTDFAVIDVPTLQFIQVDGRGDPNTAPAYVRAVEALYGVAYTVKFASKAQGRDFVVAPLEGLWWAPDPSVFTALEKDAWNWTMMISQPEWVTPAMVADACGTAAAKRPNEAIAKVRLRSLTEAARSRSCTSAPTGTRGPPSPGCTTSTCPRTACTSTASTTRSISVTRGAPRRPN